MHICFIEAGLKTPVDRALDRFVWLKYQAAAYLEVISPSCRWKVHVCPRTVAHLALIGPRPQWKGNGAQEHNICLCLSQRTAARTRSRPARSTSSTSASETWAGRYEGASVSAQAASAVAMTLEHCLPSAYPDDMLRNCPSRGFLS